MGSRMGFFSDATDDFRFDDLVRVNVRDSAQFQGQRAGRGSFLSTIQPNKSDIELEFDAINQQNLEIFRRVMAHRARPHKFFVLEPDNANQEIEFKVATENIVSTFASDNADLDVASATPLPLSTDYDLIKDLAGTPPGTLQHPSNGTALKFLYWFFQIDIEPFDTAVIDGRERLQRVGVGYNRLLFKDSGGTTQLGLKWDVKLGNTTNYVEIERLGINIDNTEDFIANVRPIDGFNSFKEVIDSSDHITIRVRNLQEQPVGFTSLNSQLDFAKGFINTWMTVWDNDDNFTFRNAFTGAGYVGTVNLFEL